MKEVKQTQVRWPVPGEVEQCLHCQTFEFSMSIQMSKERAKLFFFFPHCPSLFFFQDNANEKDFLFTKRRTNFMKLKLSPDSIELVDLISLLLFLCKSVSSCCEHNSLITHILGVPWTEGWWDTGICYLNANSKGEFNSSMQAHAIIQFFDWNHCRCILQLVK